MLAEQILERKGRAVATIAPGATVTEALQVLDEHGIGAVVVCEGDRLAGILSERDIVRRLAQRGAATLDDTVDSLMITDVFTCTGTAHVDELTEVMTSRRFRHVPVVEDGRLVGIISIGDVVKSRLDELENTTEQLVDYIRNPR